MGLILSLNKALIYLNILKIEAGNESYLVYLG